MYYSRSNLTLFYKNQSSSTWNTTRISNEFTFTDYSSIGNKLLDEKYLALVWGACKRTLPFRVWCISDKYWTIKFGKIMIAHH